MSFHEIIALITSGVSVISIVVNILQFVKKRERDKDLFMLVLTQYNNFYSIARSITRHNGTEPAHDEKTDKEIYDYIRGVVDSARCNLMNYSEIELKKKLYYQHPAFPERKVFSDDVKMGLPPEKEELGCK